MTAERPKLRVFLDEGVPIAIAAVFRAHGHEVVPFEGTVKRGAEDILVCAAAEANDAILVAFDRDMKRIARRHGVGRERFKRLSLVQLSCPEPLAAERLEAAMSFIEHEWTVSGRPEDRRIHIEIGLQVLRTWR